MSDEVIENPKCDRCNYDDADPKATVADNYIAWYQVLCKTCATKLHQRQARMEDYGGY